TVGGAEPLGAGEAVRRRVGHAALLLRRDPRQLAVDVALPRLAGTVDHLVVDGDRVAAAGDRVGATDADRGAGRRDVLDLHRVLAVGQRDLARLTGGADQLGHASPALPDPAAAGDVVVRRVGVEQLDRRAAGVAGLRVLQQLRVEDVAAVE